MNPHASKTIGEKSHARGCFAGSGRRAGEVRREGRGPDHAATLADAFAHAAILDDVEQFEPIYRQTLSVFERVYGSELLEIAVNLNPPPAAAPEAAGPKHSSSRALTAMNYALLLFELGRLEGERCLAAHASARRRGGSPAR